MRVETAIRAAAQATGGYPGSLDDVYRRVRDRRRRRRTAAGACAGVVVVLLGIGVSVNRAAEPAPPPAAVPDVAVAQRLMLDGAAGSYTGAGGATVSLGEEDAVGELLPDGRLVAHRVVGADAWNHVVGTPDGRVVAIGPRNLVRGVPMALRDQLVVVGPTGSTEVIREAGQAGAPLTLVGATSTTAYLWRRTGLVAHDLSTGNELALVPADRVGTIVAADVAGDRLAAVPRSSRCRPTVLDTSTNDVVAWTDLSPLRCDRVLGLRLSPDARSLAVAYQADDGHRVVIVSLDGGKVQADQEIPTAPRVALAWQDDRTLRVATFAAGPAQQVRAFTITAGP